VADKGGEESLLLIDYLLLEREKAVSRPVQEGGELAYFF